MLRVSDLRVELPGLRLDIKDLSVTGRTVVLGRNGSGKSTLLKSIMGIIKPTSGRVTIDGVDITELAIEKRPIGYLPQRVIQLPMKPRRQLEYFSQYYGTDYREVVDRLRIEEILNKDRLSVGELQLLVIATIMLRRPKALLLDEPCASLDWINKLLFVNVVKELNLPMLYVTHDPVEAVMIADELALLKNGKIGGLFINRYKDTAADLIEQIDLYSILE